MEAMAGLGIFGIVLFIFVSILPWIAMMCIWSNTGRTAKNTERLLAEIKDRHGLPGENHG